MSSEKKIRNDLIFWPENACFGGFGQFWPRYQFQRFQTSIFIIVQTGLRAFGKDKPNNYDFREENAELGHFYPILTCFWPVLATVSV